MKRFIALLLFIVLMLSALAGCAPQVEEAPEELKIGLAAPSSTHGWVAGVAYYAQKYCHQNDIDYVITVSADGEEMASAINELLRYGVNALVLWPQWTGMESVIDEVLQKGIPVVVFDQDIACEGLHKVTGNNYDMGYRSAEYIVSRVGDAAHIAVMDVRSAGSVSAQRKQGFYDYLNEIGYDCSNVFEVPEDAFSRDCGLEDMQRTLAEHDRIDAVFSMDDENSIGFVQAVAEAGRTDIRAITGGGGMQEYFNMIADKKYASLGLASALYSPAMIEDAIHAADLLYHGEAQDDVIVIPTTIVSAENVADYLDPENTIY